MTPPVSDTPLLVLYVRVTWAARWAILLLVFVSVSTTFGIQLRGGLGRTWEAKAKLGIDHVGDLGGALPILKARLTSGDFAREIGLPAGSSVAVVGVAVLDVTVSSTSADDSIRAANALVDRLIEEQSEARQRSEGVLSGQEAARRALVERELAAIKTGTETIRAELAALTQSVQVAATAADAAIRQAAATPNRGVIIGDTPEERRLARLERERDKVEAAADHLEQRRGDLMAPMSQAGPVTTAPRMTLTRIDRAVGATRLPSHIWTTLLCSGMGSFLLGVLLAALRFWWQDEMVKERVRNERMKAGA